MVHLDQRMSLSRMKKNASEETVDRYWIPTSHRGDIKTSFSACDELELPTYHCYLRLRYSPMHR